MKITYREFELEVDYNFYKGEQQSYDYPGSPDEVELLSIELNDIDIMELLNVDQLYDIETIILENH